MSTLIVPLNSSLIPVLLAPVGSAQETSRL
jgi:hypothetical protein